MQREVVLPWHTVFVPNHIGNGLMTTGSTRSDPKDFT